MTDGAALYERNKTQTYEQIAADLGEEWNKNKVAGLIYKHRVRHNLPPAKSAKTAGHDVDGYMSRLREGGSYADIAKATGRTRAAIIGAVDRAAQANEVAKPVVVVKTRPDPTLTRVPMHQPSVTMFANNALDRLCLWINGDMRDGSATFCPHPQETGAYCAGHAEAARGDPR